MFLTMIAADTEADTDTDVLRGRLAALLDRAEERRTSGDYRHGSAIAREAAALAERLGDGSSQAKALRSLANQLVRLGAQEEAVRACRAAVTVLETIGDQAGICEVLTAEAMPLKELGMQEEALEALERAGVIARDLGDRDLLYWVHNRTGVVHGSLGDYELSTEYLMRALTMADGMDAEARFCILNNVGDNAVHQVPQLRAKGEPTAAEQTLTDALGFLEEAMRLARLAANPFREAISMDNYGMLLALAGDHETASELIEEAQSIAVRHGYRSLESGTLQHQAHLRLIRGDAEGAVAGLLAALESAVDADEMNVVIDIHRELSEAYEKAGDLASALQYYRSYHALEREAHNDVAAARARMAAQTFELDNALMEAEEQRTRSAELERQATQDALTGLPNRRAIESRLPGLAAGGVVVAFADVDLFKGVNDRFGHLVGDEVLRRVAAVLRETVRSQDLVARFGGEEFLIALGGVGADEGRATCETLRARVAGYPWERIMPGLSVTVSLGLCRVDAGGDLAGALELADRRLYAAKHSGRNKVDDGSIESGS